MVNVTYDAASKSIISTDSDGNVYVYNPGDIAWTLATAALVWIMIPGCGFFYSGFLRRKNALSMLYLSTMTFTVVSLQWFFWGYSLVYSETGGPFWGNLRYFGLRGVLEKPPVITIKRIPSIVFCVHQLMFAAFTAMVSIGAVAERTRFGPLVVFIFLWSTLVYDPIARWTWNPQGWSFKLGGLDYAGGTPVHITSGATALAISWYLGIRKGINLRGHNYPPNNIGYIYLGTALMWFGWLGFNGGSALSANFQAAQSIVVTNVAASAGGLTYLLLEYHQWQKWSVVAFCTGVIDGLVAITPAAGYVGTPAALAFGVVAAVGCKYAYKIPLWFNLDDVVGIFQHHCIGGIIGNLLTGLFAQKSVASFDGILDIKGGFLDHNYVQLGYQLLDSIAALIYAFLITSIILWAMDFIPLLRLRDDGVRDDASFNESICDYRDDPQDGEDDSRVEGVGDMEMHHVGQDGVNGGPPLPQHA